MNDFILPSTSTLSKIKDGSVPNDLADDRRKKVEKMPSIIHLGFVIRHDAKVTENIIAACIAQLSDKGKITWKAYPRGDQAFIPMLFVTSVLVKQRLAMLADPESGMSQGEILLKKPNPRYDFILNHLFDVWTKRTSYRSLPQDLRKAMRFFFELHGQKATAQLRAPKDGLRPSQIFFWTGRDYIKQTNLQLPKAPITVSVKKVPPQSNPHIALHVPILAEQVRLHLAQPKSWQELYRRAVQRPKDLPTHLIPLHGSRIDSKQEGQKQEYEKGRPLPCIEQHLKLSEMMTRHNKILLSGPSGSGKTTIQRALMADLLSPNSSQPGCVPIFISLKDVGFGGRGVTDLIVKSVAQQILTAESLKRIIQQQITLRRAHYGDTADPKLLFEAEIRSFFTSMEQKANNEVFLFLDGYNEIPETERFNATKEIQQLAKTVTKIVVSTRAYGAKGVLPLFTRFELKELFDEQIIHYLSSHFKGRGEQLFNDKIVRSGRILSMARVPFYLELIVSYHQDYPDRRLPQSQGALLEFFEQKQHEAKQDIKAHKFPDVSQRHIDFFLQKAAYKLVDKGRQRALSVLSFPHELIDIVPLFGGMAGLTRTAEAAELLGFLDEAGDTGVLSFRHDNIRDYFAAKELKDSNVLYDPLAIASHLEYTKWDTVWLMLFGIIDDEERFQKALSDVAQHDPHFASKCLLASPLSKPCHADVLRELFSLPRISLLLSGLQYGRESSHWPLSGLTPVGRALSRILSVYASDYLMKVYFEPETDEIFRSAIPGALVLSEGENALQYFQKIVKKEGLKSHYAVFWAIAQLRSTCAYDLLTRLYIRGLRTKSCRDSLNYHLSWCIQLYRGHPATRKVLDVINRSCNIMLRKPDVRSPMQVTDLLLHLGLSNDMAPEDWLKLHGHPFTTVSFHAWYALVDLQHPLAIEEVTEVCQNADHSRLSAYGSEFSALLNSKGLEGEQILLSLLDKVIMHDETSTRPFDLITAHLAERGSPATIEKLVHLCLHKKRQLATRIMYWLASEVPRQTLRTVHSELDSGKVSYYVWERACMLRALCGDTTVKSEFLNMLEKLLKTCNEDEYLNILDRLVDVDNSDHITSNARICRLRLLWYVPKAAVNIGALDVVSILKTVLNVNAKRSLEKTARWILRQIHRSRRPHLDVDRLIASLERCNKDSDSCIMFFKRFARSARFCPAEKMRYVFQYMRAAADEAVLANDTKEATFFYYGIESLRRVWRPRRFLEPLYGWPAMPHPNGMPAKRDHPVRQPTPPATKPYVSDLGFASWAHHSREPVRVLDIMTLSE